MNTAILTIRTEPLVKKRAQKVAKSLGFSLSSLINVYLRYFIKTKTVYFQDDITHLHSEKKSKQK